MLNLLPNLITSVRILGTICLLFVKPFTVAFYIIYTISGLSDLLDGFIARRLKLVSELGSKLDSIADLLFYAVMLLRIFPVLLKVLPHALWTAVSIVVLIRILAYIVAAIKYHRFASQHTWLNKASGASVFLIPYIINLQYAVPICCVLCSIAGLASLEELMIHLVNKEYRSEVRSLIGSLLSSSSKKSVAKP